MSCQCCHDNRLHSAVVTEPPPGTEKAQSWDEMGPVATSVQLNWSIPRTHVGHVNIIWVLNDIKLITEASCRRAACWGGTAHHWGPPPPLCADNQRCQTCVWGLFSGAALWRRRCSPNTDAAHWKLHVNLPFLKTAIVALSPSCNLQDSRLGVWAIVPILSDLSALLPAIIYNYYRVTGMSVRHRIDPFCYCGLMIEGLALTLPLL